MISDHFVDRTQNTKQKEITQFSYWNNVEGRPSLGKYTGDA